MTIKKLFEHLRNDYWENIQERGSLSGLTTETQWFDALIHLKNYAYERNISGAAFVYREIADIVLAPLKTRENWRYDLEKTLWENFQDECERREIKPNLIVDPLKPSDKKKTSLVKFVWDIDDKIDKTVAEWAFRMILEDRLKDAHNKIKTVWGIADKIASFYLRDIFWLGNNLKPGRENWSKKNLHLLQPVDIWIERAAKALGHVNNSKQSIAKFICSFEKNNDLLPGEGNIGFWMLGSNYLKKDEFDDIVKAITSNSSESAERACDVAGRIEKRGKFGAILRKTIKNCIDKH